MSAYYRLLQPLLYWGMVVLAKCAKDWSRRCSAALLTVGLLCGSALAVEIEVFVRPGCPRCEEAERFLAALERERPELHADIRDIRSDPAALQRLRELAAHAGVPAPGVPAFNVGGEFMVGYSGAATSGARIRALLDRRSADAQPQSDPGASCALAATVCAADAAPADEAIRLPWLDTRIDVAAIGLPLFTIVIGLLDGFNPCSMWVLVMMISILAGSGDRRRMLAIAGTFVAVEGIAYFAFMAAWLNLFLLIGLSRASEVVLGAIALSAGLINVKDFWAFGRGPSLSIPAAAKPGIYARLRRILRQQNMAVAIAGTAVLAVLVQIVELLCTSGFPALYTRILTLRRLDAWTYYGYLLLYNAMYMLDDVVVLAIGVITLSQQRLQEAAGRRLKLVAGVVMLALGLYLIAAPR